MGNLAGMEMENNCLTELQKKFEPQIYPSGIELYSHLVFNKDVKNKVYVIGIKILFGQVKKGQLFISKKKCTFKILSIQSKNKEISNADAGEKVAVKISTSNPFEKILEESKYYLDIRPNLKKAKVISKIWPLSIRNFLEKFIDMFG